MTKKLYLHPNTALTGTARVTLVNAATSRVRLDQTVFHVKGGGQLADWGTIGAANVRVSPAANGDAVVRVSVMRVGVGSGANRPAVAVATGE